MHLQHTIAQSWTDLCEKWLHVSVGSWKATWPFQLFLALKKQSLREFTIPKCWAIRWAILGVGDLQSLSETRRKLDLLVRQEVSRIGSEQCWLRHEVCDKSQE